MVEGCQCIGQGGHAAIDGAHRDVGQIADDHVGSARAEFGTGFAGAVHTDDEPEPARAGCCDAGFGILHDDGAGRSYTEAAGGLEQHGRIGLSRKVEFFGDHTVHPHTEEIGDTRRVEHCGAVAAGREDRDGHTGVPQPVHQGDGGSEDRHARGDLPVEALLFAVAEPTDGVLVTGCRRRTPRQRDAARG